jgi:hypothetical protein
LPEVLRARRSRAQIAKDEKAVIAIAEQIKRVDRFSMASLRDGLDAIGDLLVEAGRL